MPRPTNPASWVAYTVLTSYPLELRVYHSRRLELHHETVTRLPGTATHLVLLSSQHLMQPAYDVLSWHSYFSRPINRLAEMFPQMVTQNYCARKGQYAPPLSTCFHTIQNVTLLRSPYLPHRLNIRLKSNSWSCLDEHLEPPHPLDPLDSHRYLAVKDSRNRSKNKDPVTDAEGLDLEARLPSVARRVSPPSPSFG